MASSFVSLFVFVLVLYFASIVEWITLAGEGEGEFWSVVACFVPTCSGG